MEIVFEFQKIEMTIEMTLQIFVVMGLCFTILNGTCFRTIVTQEQNSVFFWLLSVVVFNHLNWNFSSIIFHFKLKLVKVNRFLVMRSPQDLVLVLEWLILVRGFLVVMIFSIFVPSYVFFVFFFIFLYFLSKIFIFWKDDALEKYLHLYGYNDDNASNGVFQAVFKTQAQLLYEQNQEKMVRT